MMGIRKLDGAGALHTEPLDRDLNLLRFLEAVLDTGSVTRSGERMGMSQPAASRTMTRLRAALNDPLLVRTTQGYVLTPLAQSLRPSVARALAAASEVFAPVQFDPASSHRTFRFCASDYGTLAVVVPLCARLAAVAPHVSVTVTPWSEISRTDMERGAVDLALHCEDAIPLDFHYRNLFRESFAVIARLGHPLLEALPRTRGPAMLKEIARYRHAVPSYHNGRTVVDDVVLGRLGIGAAAVRVTIPYFNLAPMVVAESDLVMVLPRRIALRYASMLPIGSADIPMRRLEFDYRVVWHDRVHRDAGVRWLREEVHATMARLPA